MGMVEVIKALSLLKAAFDVLGLAHHVEGEVSKLLPRFVGNGTFHVKAFECQNTGQHGDTHEIL